MLNFVIQSFQMKDKAIKRAETICAQAIKEKKNTQPHQMSVCFSSAFRFDQLSDSIKAFENQPGTHVYSRYGNPTMESVAAKIAALEIAGSDISAHGLLTSSGMSAIYLAVTALLGKGDMIITQANLYGGTTELFNKVIQPQGIKLVYIDLSNLEKVEKSLRQNHYTRSFTWKLHQIPLHCYDIQALAELASRYHAFLIVDNTFALQSFNNLCYWVRI
ncbi:MAG: PLP-dependent transferase [Saprospiraceae bacterium]|nr:PLP-dependent transferase [Saprospiraceae bacterium]